MRKARKYIDFKLYLTKSAVEPGHFQVSLLPTPEVGESILPVTFSTSAGAYAENLADIKKRRINNKYLLDVGKQLADWLLPEGSIRDLFRDALRQVKNEGGVRLRLIIVDHALKQIPWEFVYNPISKADAVFDFLALDPRISIVRHEPLDSPHPQPIELEDNQADLGMYTASAAPDWAAPLAVEQEVKQIKEMIEQTRAMGRRKGGVAKINPTFVKDAEWKQVKDELDSPGRYQFFHFAGHGKTYTEENPFTLDDIELGKLLFQDSQAESGFVSAGSFADVMQTANIWLVTLGACETGIRSISHPWHSLVGALMEHNIPAVVAMQNEIGDAAAVVFGREFYGKIAAGLTLDEAMSWSRREMAAKTRDQNDQQNNMEWGIPVLYTRLVDGVLVPAFVERGSDTADEARDKTQEQVDSIIRISHDIDTLEAEGDFLGVNAAGVDMEERHVNVEATTKAKSLKGKFVGVDLS